MRDSWTFFWPTLSFISGSFREGNIWSLSSLRAHWGTFGNPNLRDLPPSHLIWQRKESIKMKRAALVRFGYARISILIQCKENGMPFTLLNQWNGLRGIERYKPHVLLSMGPPEDAWKLQNLCIIKPLHSSASLAFNQAAPTRQALLYKVEWKYQQRQVGDDTIINQIQTPERFEFSL